MSGAARSAATCCIPIRWSKTLAPGSSPATSRRCWTATWTTSWKPSCASTPAAKARRPDSRSGGQRRSSGGGEPAFVAQGDPDAGEDDHGPDDVGLANEPGDGLRDQVERTRPVGKWVDDQQVVDGGRRRETDPGQQQGTDLRARHQTGQRLTNEQDEWHEEHHEPKAP